MISEKNDTIYREEVQNFVGWCDQNYLHLNVSKTKEMIVDFTRTRGSQPQPIHISGVEVERVEAYKYLGVEIDNKLTFKENTSLILKKVQPRLYCLNKLRSFNVSTDILQSFYTATISSVVLYGAVCWGGNVAEREKERLDKIAKKAGSVIGKRQQTFDVLYEQKLSNRIRNILSDSTHPLYSEFDTRRIDRSGRIRVPNTRTQRYKHSFLPRSITLFNQQHLRIIV